MLIPFSGQEWERCPLWTGALVVPKADFLGILVSSYFMSLLKEKSSQLPRKRINLCTGLILSQNTGKSSER